MTVNISIWHILNKRDLCWYIIVLFSGIIEVSFKVNEIKYSIFEKINFSTTNLKSINKNKQNVNEILLYVFCFL